MLPFEIVYPFACLMAAIMLPVMITPWMPDRARKVKPIKQKARRKVKKHKTKKQKAWYKAPKLSPQQQAAIERYRLGGNRSQIEIGGAIPI